MTRKIDWPRVRKARRRLEALARAQPELLSPPSDENRRGWETDLEEIMGRPPSQNEPTVQVAFRLPESLIARLDEYVEHMKRSAPGVNVTRADAVRYLLNRGLDGDAETKRKR